MMMMTMVSFFYERLVVHCTTWSWYWESKSCNLITALICNRGREREMQQSLQRINSKYQTLISHRTSKSFRSCSSSTSSMRTVTSSSVRARLSPCQLPSFKLSKGTRSNRAGAQICYFCQKDLSWMFCFGYMYSTIIDDDIKTQYD